MADRVYPASKPTTVNGNGTAPAPAAAANQPFPATKAQLYGATRPTYRPQASHRRHRRGCCCTLCIWITLAIILLVFAAAIAAAVIYLLYRPHRPTFTVTALKLSYLNVTSSSTVNSRFDLNVTARNPNKKVTYSYDPIDVSIFADGVDIGDGSFPSFVHGKKNTTLLTVAITSDNGQPQDSGSVSALKSDLKSKNGLNLKIKLDTKVKVKMGALKSPMVGIRVTCDGIKASVPTGNSTSTASTGSAKCKVNTRIKIWKWVI